ncbi:unnamed protein product [Caretta caretta]
MVFNMAHLAGYRLLLVLNKQETVTLEYLLIIAGECNFWKLHSPRTKTQSINQNLQETPQPSDINNGVSCISVDGISESVKEIGGNEPRVGEEGVASEVVQKSETIALKKDKRRRNIPQMMERKWSCEGQPYRKALL